MQNKENKAKLAQYLNAQFMLCGISMNEIAEIIEGNYKNIRSAKANVRNFLLGISIINESDYVLIQNHLLNNYNFELNLSYRELRQKFNCLKIYQRGVGEYINIRTSKKNKQILKEYADSIGVTVSSFVNVLIENWITENKDV